VSIEFGAFESITVLQHLRNCRDIIIIITIIIITVIISTAQLQMMYCQCGITCDLPELRARHCFSVLSVFYKIALCFVFALTNAVTWLNPLSR